MARVIVCQGIHVYLLNNLIHILYPCTYIIFIKKIYFFCECFLRILGLSCVCVFGVYCVVVDVVLLFLNDFTVWISPPPM